VATGRYIDRDRLHYVDFTGRWFSVKGPSITPRPPQGQPPVVALAHAAVPYRFAAAHADVVLVTPRDADHAADLIVEVRAAEPERPEPVRVYADALVLVGADAADRLRRLDDAAGVALGSDAAILAGTPERIADELAAWHAAGITGFRLRPAVLPHDLTGVTRGLVPELRARGLFRRAYEADTLRGLLGLPAAGNRYERRTA
jgi:alkanesulfonate monooxygenase SsuD/methylene tetrahydromethanopterin reductase-like flavin-dependent oxidoreductase (luciferase family)